MISVSRYRRLSDLEGGLRPRWSSAFVRAFVLLVSLAVVASPARAAPDPSVQPAGQASQSGASPASHPRRTGLIVGGVVTFAIAYAIGVLAIFDSLGSSNGMCPCPDRNHWAADLLIPVAGPWIAIGASPNDAGLFAFLGVLQATGVALTVGGIVRYSNDGAKAAGGGQSASGPPRVMSFGLLPTRDGAFGFLSGRM